MRLPSFAALACLEPRLGALLAEVRRHRERGVADSFCRTKAWRGEGGQLGLELRLERLVGPRRVDGGDPLLRTDVALAEARFILRLDLPHCPQFCDCRGAERKDQKGQR